MVIIRILSSLNVEYRGGGAEEPGRIRGGIRGGGAGGRRVGVGARVGGWARAYAR